MRNVLLLTPEMIPSAILCGDKPLSFLRQQGKIGYRWKRPREVRGEDLRWADILVFVRSDDPLSLRIAKTARRAGRATVYVLDDDLLNLPDGLQSSEDYHRPEKQAAIRGIMAECGLFLSPSRELLKKYGPLFPRAERIEEPAGPVFPPIPREDGRIRIGFAGSVDRTADIDQLLSGALRTIVRSYPQQVTVEFFGAAPAIARELGLRCLPFCESYEEYVQTMRSRRWDIALAPMPDTPFGRCKHYNKYIEYASYGIPTVFSDVFPYRWAVRDGENGLLCENTEEAWTAALRRLIEDPTLRERISRTAMEEAGSIYSLESVAETWERLLSSLEIRPVKSRELTLFALIRIREWFAWVWEKTRAYGWKTPYYILRKILRTILRLDK